MIQQVEEAQVKAKKKPKTATRKFTEKGPTEARKLQGGLVLNEGVWQVEYPTLLDYLHRGIELLDTWQHMAGLKFISIRKSSVRPVDYQLKADVDSGGGVICPIVLFARIMQNLPTRKARLIGVVCNPVNYTDGLKFVMKNWPEIPDAFDTLRITIDEQSKILYDAVTETGK